VCVDSEAAGWSVQEAAAEGGEWCGDGAGMVREEGSAGPRATSSPTAVMFCPERAQPHNRSSADLCGARGVWC
jgi:hypothetical protein